MVRGLILFVLVDAGIVPHHETAGNG